MTGNLLPILRLGKYLRRFSSLRIEWCWNPSVSGTRFLLHKLGIEFFDSLSEVEKKRRPSLHSYSTFQREAASIRVLPSCF